MSISRMEGLLVSTSRIVDSSFKLCDLNRRKDDDSNGRCYYSIIKAVQLLVSRAGDKNFHFEPVQHLKMFNT